MQHPEESGFQASDLMLCKHITPDLRELPVVFVLLEKKKFIPSKLSIGNKSRDSKSHFVGGNLVSHSLV